MSYPNPASLLHDEVLETGWHVLNHMERHPASTGGFFSVGYLVEHLVNHQRAYLKALDFSRAFQAADFARELQNLTAAFNFERDIMQKCRDHRMRRVLTPLCDGVHRIPSCPKPLDSVHYLIFELAEGDIRAFQASLDQFDLAWSLRSLHHSAVGLMELHIHGIAHQDLKPSNILTFTNRSSKIADLGRAFDTNLAAPHDAYRIPGDKTYASPEQMYGLIDSCGLESRKAADVYALGNLLFFHFTGLAATQAMLEKMKTARVPLTSDFAHDLPYWKQAFEEVIQDMSGVTAVRASRISPSILQLARELCEPDPSFRGDPKAHTILHQSNYTLERYISRFDHLAKLVEYEMK